jgi:putative transposase
MARKPRLVVPNGYYHAVSRGNNRQLIFDDTLRRLHLLHLGEVVREFDWEVYAWALMSSHYHLVFRIGELGLSEGMHRLNLRLARASNARFGRINHSLGQRFWSTNIETDEHFFASIRYTLWNPARAGIGAHPEDSSWTSFRPSVGLEWPPKALATSALLAHFGSNPDRARAAFKRFVWAGRERCLEPWQEGEGILR